MARVLGDDHLLELEDGRSIGYATWGDPEGTTVFLGHGMPGSRLDHYAGLDDPEWVRRRRVRFVGVDRPGYGYSDPWQEASLLDCAGDFVRVADHLGLERFAALGVSGGARYVIALGALAPERVGRIAVVCAADIGLEEGETPEEMAADVGEQARMLRENPEEWYAGLVAEVTEADRPVLERPEVRASAVETFQEAVRQGAVGWIDDVLRQERPWPFGLDEIGADVSFHHGEDDTLAPPQYAEEIAEGIPGSRLRLYPGEGHISILDRLSKEIVENLLAHYPGRRVRERRPTARYAPKCVEKLSGKSGCAPKWGSEGGQEGSKRPRSATSQRPVTTLQKPQVIFQTVSPRSPVHRSRTRALELGSWHHGLRQRAQRARRLAR